MLAGVGRALVEFVAPEVSSVYGRTELGYAINLIGALARESEGAVAGLVEENAALRRLLREAGRRLSGSSLDAGLVAELQAIELSARSPDLRLSALRDENRRLFDVFVRLQAACEDAPGGERGLNMMYRKSLTFLHVRAESQSGAPRR
jgi:hypothetical protein